MNVIIPTYQYNSIYTHGYDFWGQVNKSHDVWFMNMTQYDNCTI